tara:strand:- start:174 stop:1124 length:951 start_codon:yes stop_codon:yes gene_type:complete
VNFALIVDDCKVESYVVRDKKAYEFSNPNIPYQFHHSIGNECFIGFWGYPFVFDGCFINWKEWTELPNLDLDVIFVTIEKRFNECKIEDLRKKYPNAIIISAIKELWNWNSEWMNRMDVFNNSDKVFVPISDINQFPQLVQNCSKEICFLPQPIDIDYLYNNFYLEERDESIFVYDPSHNRVRQGKTVEFAKYIGDKYNIPLSTINTQNNKNQWYDFLKVWTKSTFHFNLDPVPFYPGQQSIQCASMGVIQIGGVNDSHKLLWPETYTNDFSILEEKFVGYLNNYDTRINVIQDAFTKVEEIYSFKSVFNKFLELM